MNRPPSSGLKKGTGKDRISTSLPLISISRTGPESTILALTGFFIVSCIHSRAMSQIEESSGMSRAMAKRLVVVNALVKTGMS